MSDQTNAAIVCIDTSDQFILHYFFLFVFHTLVFSFSDKHWRLEYLLYYIPPNPSLPIKFSFAQPGQISNVLFMTKYDR